MRKGKKALVKVAVIFLLFSGVFLLKHILFYIGSSVGNPSIFSGNRLVRQAIRKDDLRGEYIICKYRPVTGGYWMLEEETEDAHRYQYVIINGSDPSKELSHEFLTWDNQYCFYVVSKREVYSEDLWEETIEYTVSGWDIIYPVQHEPFSIIPLQKNGLIERDYSSFWNEE